MMWLLVVGCIWIMNILYGYMCYRMGQQDQLKWYTAQCERIFEARVDAE